MFKFRRYIFCESSANYGGQEEQILRTMQVLTQAGSQCLLVCRPHSKIAAEATLRHLPWRPVAFRNSIDILSIWKLRKILIQQKIEVAFCHSGHDTDILSAACHLIKGGPLLIRVRTYLPGIPRARSFSAMDRILVPSAFMRRHLQGNPEIDSTRVDVLRPSLDMENIRQSSEKTLPAELEEFLQAHSPVVVHAAMLRSEKGHKMAISMVATLCEKFPRIGYIIAGTGTEEEKLRRLVGKLGMKAHVCFAGFVSPVSALMARADLVIMPSLKEPLGLAQLEALVLGIPVAVSDAGGLPETVVSGISGWILPADNLAAWVQGVSEALSDPPESEKRADRGRNLVEEAYGEQNYLDKLEEQVQLAQATRDERVLN